MASSEIRQQVLPSKQVNMIKTWSHVARIPDAKSDSPAGQPTGTNGQVTPSTPVPQANGQVPISSSGTAQVFRTTKHNIKYTKNTQAWWQLHTHWSNADFEQRRTRIYERVRQKWPKKHMLNGHGASHRSELRDHLMPIVSSIDDSGWASRDPSAATLDQRLEKYASWALFLNNYYRRAEDKIVSGVSRSPAFQPQAQSFLAGVPPKTMEYRSSTPRTVTANAPFGPSPRDSDRGRIATPISQPPRSRQGTEYWSETNSDVSGNETKPTIADAPISLATTPVDWDEVEVQIDADALELDEVLLPMLDLKPAPRGEPCNWEDFDLQRLYQSFEQETGVKVNSQSHEFVYTANGTELAFYRPGAYKVMLKRFAQVARGKSDILVLSIRFRQQLHRSSKVTKRVLQPVTPQSRTSRGKSHFTGSDEDFSSEESRSEPPAKRSKHQSGIPTRNEDNDEDIDNADLELLRVIDATAAADQPVVPGPAEPSAVIFTRGGWDFSEEQSTVKQEKPDG